jgi:hypothetical protein
MSNQVSGYSGFPPPIELTVTIQSNLSMQSIEDFGMTYVPVYNIRTLSENK